MSKYCEKCGCYLPVGEEKCPACGYSKKTEIKHDKFLEATYKEINRMKNTNVFNNTSNSFVWKPEDYINVANKPEVVKARIESQINAYSSYCGSCAKLHMDNGCSYCEYANCEITEASDSDREYFKNFTKTYTCPYFKEENIVKKVIYKCV